MADIKTKEIATFECECRAEDIVFLSCSGALPSITPLQDVNLSDIQLWFKFSISSYRSYNWYMLSEL